MKTLPILAGAGLLALALTTAPAASAGQESYFSIRLYGVQPHYDLQAVHYRQHYRGYYDQGRRHGLARRHHRWPRYHPWYDPRDYRDGHGRHYWKDDRHGHRWPR